MERYCIRCGKRLEQRVGEVPSHFKVRRTCSAECLSLVRRQQTKKWYASSGSFALMPPKMLVPYED